MSLVRPRTEVRIDCEYPATNNEYDTRKLIKKPTLSIIMQIDRVVTNPGEKELQLIQTNSGKVFRDGKRRGGVLPFLELQRSGEDSQLCPKRSLPLGNPEIETLVHDDRTTQRGPFTDAHLHLPLLYLRKLVPWAYYHQSTSLSGSKRTGTTSNLRLATTLFMTEKISSSC